MKDAMACLLSSGFAHLNFTSHLLLDKYLPFKHCALLKGTACYYLRDNNNSIIINYYYFFLFGTCLTHLAVYLRPPTAKTC